MARLHGKAGTFKLDTDGGGSTEAVLAITAWSIDYAAAADEATAMTNAGVAEFVGGVTRWSGSASGYWDTDEDYTKGAPPLITPGARLEATLELEADEDAYSGDVIVTSFKPEVAVDAVIKWSVDFQGTDALTPPA